MDKHIFIREEFIEKIGIDAETLAQWEKAKLILPTGYTDDKIPCYDHDSVAQVGHILKLQELGYGPEEIEKIVKKVGLPQAGDVKKEKGDKNQYLTVGHLAERVGVSPRTLKHWEDKGIIAPDMRSEGGHRLYSGQYELFCHLIMDLQHFGYSLEEIKTVSDYFREFLALKADLEASDMQAAALRMEEMFAAIDTLFTKMEHLKAGITRWEDLLKKKKKELNMLRTQNQKRALPQGKKSNSEASK